MCIVQTKVKRTLCKRISATISYVRIALKIITLIQIINLLNYTKNDWHDIKSLTLCGL